VDAREELRLPPHRRRTARLRARSAPESDLGLAKHRSLQPPRPLETPPARCALMLLLRRRARSPPRRRTTRLRARSAPESESGPARRRSLQPPRPLETPPPRCALLPLLRRRARSLPRRTQLPASLQL
jgi:hypothetical protein